MKFSNCFFICIDKIFKYISLIIFLSSIQDNNYLIIYIIIYKN